MHHFYYRRLGALLLLLVLTVAGERAYAEDDANGAAEFHKSIEPILQNYCYDCHGDGAHKGKVAFDQFKSDADVLTNRDLWWKALKNVRAGIMPPAKKPCPTAQERDLMAHWIKTDVFDSDPQEPDPGRVTLRRLNRAEYHNTIRDLLGVDFNTQEAFPPDDTGYGFDTIGDVLTLPPMLLEKYMNAAEKIVAQAVPQMPLTEPKHVISGKRFLGIGNDGSKGKDGGLVLSYYSAAAVSNTAPIKWAGQYQVSVDLTANEKYVDNEFDYNKCRLIFTVDGKETFRQDYNREGDKHFHYDFNEDWAAGDHQLAFQLQPLTPDKEQVRNLTLQIVSVTLHGPAAREHWVPPDNYTKFFPTPVPTDKKARRQYAKELLGNFASRAFRRPVDDKTLNRLTALAESVYSQNGKTFEAGVAEGMVAVLSSPRFLFREESTEPSNGKERYPLIDEYALASRLSYFLWSSMPDEELTRLANQGRLRDELPGQVERMMKDWKFQGFVQDFTGQWLRVRDILDWPIDARSVLQREEKADPERERLRTRFHQLNDKSDEQLTKDEKTELAEVRKKLFANFRRPPKVNFNYELRNSMKMETEKVFDYVIQNDRPVLELIDSDYTFLNHRLALHYGITNVQGDDMRLVKLPAESGRGGVLTEGTVLVATSNPTRTSPVKRGLFILDSILGTPPPPPPANIPPLEDAAKGATNVLTLRETLARHRADALCSSCHNRMDPLGLAFENFNAMGMWRKGEYGVPIDATGTLASGESFTNVTELKHILVTKHAEDFYRTLTEKMLTYAVGRGLDYYDVDTVDQIVARLEANNGRASQLIAGVVESAPFQKCRRTRGGQPVALNMEIP